jgi:ribosome-binding factor A
MNARAKVILMPKEFPRTRRVGEQIQRELAELIRDELKDPRLGMISISQVTVSRDMAHAKVFVSVLGNEQQTEASMEVLGHAAGFLRHKLGKILHMRVIPELHFFLDRSLEEGARIGALINAAIASDRGNKEDE